MTCLVVYFVTDDRTRSYKIKENIILWILLKEEVDVMQKIQVTHKNREANIPHIKTHLHKYGRTPTLVRKSHVVLFPR